MESSDHPEFYLNISGSPQLRDAMKRVAQELGNAFRIESDRDINDPAAQGLTLTEAVAIVTIISGSLTAVDLSTKLIAEIEQSKVPNVSFSTPGGEFHYESKDHLKFTPEQRKAVETLFDSSLRQ